MSLLNSGYAMTQPRLANNGFSLTELLAVIAILGALAAIILPRLIGHDDEADIAACHTYKGDIEIQVEIWRHNTGSWPLTTLTDIGAEPDYFPDGLPVCPADGTGYTIDANGRVVGHVH